MTLKQIAEAFSGGHSDKVYQHFSDNIIVDNYRVAIDGTAEFVKDGKRVSYVWACDVYEFNDQKELGKITSYCIQEKL